MIHRKRLPPRTRKTLIWTCRLTIVLAFALLTIGATWLVKDYKESWVQPAPDVIGNLTIPRNPYRVTVVTPRLAAVITAIPIVFLIAIFLAVVAELTYHVDRYE